MDSSAKSFDALHAFWDSFYRCFGRRADALFELTDALLTTGTAPSLVRLSLAPVHRRAGAAPPLRRPAAWAAGPARSKFFDRRRETLLRLRHQHQLLEPLRCGGESGAGVLLPSVQALFQAAHRRWLGLPTGRGALLGHRAHILVLLHSNRTSYAAPEVAEPKPVGRLRRHGRKFALPDPKTWTPPSAETLWEITGTTQGTALRSDEAPPGREKGRLSLRRPSKLAF